MTRPTLLTSRKSDGGYPQFDCSQARLPAYDVVLNGRELGSIRIHRQDIQSIIFKALGMSPEDQQLRFGYFLEALQNRKPPHGGIALGLDHSKTAEGEAREIPPTGRLFHPVGGPSH